MEGQMTQDVSSSLSSDSSTSNEVPITSQSVFGRSPPIQENNKNEQLQQEQIHELEKLEKFKFQGQEWTLKDLEKALMRQKDYTQKTQSLADERKAFESERKYSDNLTADLMLIMNNPDRRDMLIKEFLNVYPQKYHQSLKQVLSGSVSPQQASHQSQQSQGPDIDLMSRLQTLESFHHNQEVSKNKMEIDSIIQKLSSQFPDAIPELAIGRVFEAFNQILEQNPNAKLTTKMWEDTFKSVDREMKSRDSQRYGNFVKKQVEANKKAKSPEAGGGTPARAPTKFKSLKDVTDFAVKDMTGRK